MNKKFQKIVIIVMALSLLGSSAAWIIATIFG